MYVLYIYIYIRKHKPTRLLWLNGKASDCDLEYCGFESH